MTRNAQSVLHQRRKSIGSRARSTQAVEFFNVLTSPQLLPEHRGRLYPPTAATGDVSALARQTGRLLSQKARAVKLVDGTGLSMPDTAQNQAVYPQPGSQASGVGFALARRVMVICLATSAALDAAIGPHSGKVSGELGLVRHLLAGLGQYTFVLH